MEYTHDWFSPNVPFLTKVLSAIAHKEFLKGLEIGCYEGMSTNWFMEHIFDGHGSELCCIDHFEGAPDTEAAGVDMGGVQDRFRMNTSQWGTRVRLIIAPSAWALTDHLAREKYDFIYVDGNHTSAGVLEDAVLAWPLLKPDGIMVFDDYLWGADTQPPEEKPKLGIDSFLAAYRGKLKIIEQGYQVAITKVKP
jgi:predicted O-methyltransferase YrrM